MYFRLKIILPALVAVLALVALIAAVVIIKNNSSDETPDKTEVNKMNEYVNPLLEGADPFVLNYGGKYYLYCTSADDGYKLYVSDDLTDWKEGGYSLKKGDVKGEGGFWAPEVMERGGKFYMVYTADEHIGIAVSDSPRGPFRQAEKRWLSERKAIDGHFFVDDDGSVYLYYVRFDNANLIYGAKLSDDLTLDEENEKFILRTSYGWEQMDCDVAEGPFVLKHDGKYYLTYSVNHTRSPYYAVACAVSSSPLSGFEKYEEPILSKTDAVVGTGHHSFVKTNKGELAIVYHCHASPTTFRPRMVCVDRAAFVTENGETVLKVFGPTNTPQKKFG